MFLPWRADEDRFLEFGWKSLLAVVAAWNILRIVLAHHRSFLQLAIIIFLLVLIVSCAAEAASQGAVVAAVDLIIDTSRALMAVAVAIVIQLAIQSSGCNTSLAIKVIASIAFVIVYAFAGRYIRPSMRGAVTAGGHAWMHNANTSPASKVISVLWGILTAIATVYLLTALVLGPEFTRNSLFFPAIGATLDHTPAGNNFIQGVQQIYTPLYRTLQGCPPSQ